MPSPLPARRRGAHALPLLVALVALLLPAGPALAGKPPSGTATPSLVAAVSLTPDSGPAGSATTVSGRGFPKRATVTVTGGATTWTGRTAGDGTFSHTLTVSATSTGSVPVTAAAGGITATAAFTVVEAEPAPQPAPDAGLRFGLSVPSGFWGAAEVRAVADLVGETPSLELAFTDFTRGVDLAGLGHVRDRGAVPVLTLEPWQAGAGIDQPAYSLDALTAGQHDAYLREFAQGLATFGSPVLLRFAHEMNGTWYPWAEGVNGNGAGDYVAAWRHVHGLVEGIAPNVSWVWAPNVPYTGSTPLPGLYPGAEYVDVVAYDGYNFGASQTWSSWQSPQQLFATGLTQLRELAPGKEIVVTETASAEQGGDKAAWVRELLAYLDAQPDVTGLVWFHHDKEADWRIDSSPASATAFREALAATRA